MSTLQIATAGHIPLCPIGLASNGYIHCDAEQPTGGWDKGIDLRFLNPPGSPGEPEEREQVTRILRRGETEITYPEPVHRPHLPAFIATPLDEIEDLIDRQLAIYLRIMVIREHAEVERAFAEELRFLEEALAVILALED